MEKGISVIVPVYNEEDNLHPLMDRLVPVLEGMGVEWEVLFVNDGSGDRSLEILRGLARDREQVRYLSFSRNFGHQIAVSAGLDHTRGKAVVIIDADLQDPPELIARLYEKLQEGYEVVYAKRRSRAGETWFKKYTARTFYRTLKSITSIDIPLDTGDFRIISQKVVEVLRRMPERQKYVRGQIAWVGFRQTYLEYDRHERHAGQSHYNLKRMFHLALSGITGFSDFPLRIASGMGFLFSFVAFLYIIYIIIAKFVWPDYPVRGWTSVMVAVLFLGGVQLVCLGIIGEYLARISSDAKGRPLYVIEEQNGN